MKVHDAATAAEAQLERKRQSVTVALADVLAPGETVLDVGPAKMKKRVGWPRIGRFEDAGGQAVITNQRLIYVDGWGTFLIAHQALRYCFRRPSLNPLVRCVHIGGRDGEQAIISGGRSFTKNWLKLVRMLGSARSDRPARVANGALMVLGPWLALVVVGGIAEGITQEEPDASEPAGQTSGPWDLEGCLDAANADVACSSYRAVMAIQPVSSGRCPAGAVILPATAAHTAACAYRLR